MIKKSGERLFWVCLHLQTNPGHIRLVPSPIDCYLCNRGLKTLQVRMEKHFENGMAVAQFLESNPQVEKVIYPGMLICFLSTCGYSRILHVIPCILFM